MTPAEKHGAMIRRKFGQRLRAARVKRFPDAEHFAWLVGIAELEYLRLEAGQAACDWALMTRLCNALGVTPNDLFPEAVNEPAKRPAAVAGSNVVAFPRRA
jgi:DNA-binding XRE family transcriptional regulator